MRSSIGNLEILEEQFVGVDDLAAHLLDLVNLDPPAVEIGVEQAEPVGRLLHLVQRRGARQQQDLLRDLRGRNPDLLPVDDIAIVLRHRAGLELRGVESGVRFGDGETGLLAALDHRRQHPLALLLGAEHHDRIEAEHVDVDGGGARHAGAALRDRAHHDRGFGDAEPGTAIGLGNADAEPSRIGQRLVEIVREAALVVLPQPIGVVEILTDLGDRVTDGLLLVGEGEVHADALDLGGIF